VLCTVAVKHSNESGISTKNAERLFLAIGAKVTDPLNYMALYEKVIEMTTEKAVCVEQPALDVLAIIQNDKIDIMHKVNAKLELLMESPYKSAYEQ